MLLTYQFRLLPTRKQHCALRDLLESQRLLYNAALEERIGAYRHGVARSYCDQTMALTEWRRSDTDARSVPANMQRETLKRLDNAYQRFLQRLKRGLKPGFPRFKGASRWHSFGFREFTGIRFDGGRLRFKGMPGGLRVHLHRPCPNGIRSCTFRRDAKGWKVGFSVDVPVSEPRVGGPSVGIDLGITTFAVLSDGGFIPSLRAARKAERRLRLAQRSLARKQRHSRGRSKARQTLARCSAKVARSRSNHLHQAAAHLNDKYDVVALEALNLTGLNRGFLARDAHDAGWGKFRLMLRYKAERAGVQLIEVDPRGTSQECSGCGERVGKRLSDRVHSCPKCGLVIDRDLNAAVNIINRAGVGPGLLNVAINASVQAEISVRPPSTAHRTESLPNLNRYEA